MTTPLTQIFTLTLPTSPRPITLTTNPNPDPDPIPNQVGDGARAGDGPCQWEERSRLGSECCYGTTSRVALGPATPDFSLTTVLPNTRTRYYCRPQPYRYAQGARNPYGLLRIRYVPRTASWCTHKPCSRVRMVHLLGAARSFTRCLGVSLHNRVLSPLNIQLRC